MLSYLCVGKITGKQSNILSKFTTYVHHQNEGTTYFRTKL